MGMEMIKHDTNEDLKLLYSSFEVSLDSIKSLIKIKLYLEIIYQ